MASGHCGLPRRLVSPEPCAKAEAPTKADNPRFFEKISFLENFVLQIPDKYVSTGSRIQGPTEKLIAKTEKSKNEKKNQNHPKNKNLSDNCRAVIAHRSV